jgi:hypothetical protein
MKSPEKSKSAKPIVSSDEEKFDAVLKHNNVIIGEAIAIYRKEDFRLKESHDLIDHIDNAYVASIRLYEGKKSFLHLINDGEGYWPKKDMEKRTVPMSNEDDAADPDDEDVEKDPMSENEDNYNSYGEDDLDKPPETPNEQRYEYKDDEADPDEDQDDNLFEDDQKDLKQQTASKPVQKKKPSKTELVNRQLRSELNTQSTKLKETSEALKLSQELIKGIDKSFRVYHKKMKSFGSNNSTVDHDMDLDAIGPISNGVGENGKKVIRLPSSLQQKIANATSVKGIIMTLQEYLKFPFHRLCRDSDRLKRKSGEEVEMTQDFQKQFGTWINCNWLKKNKKLDKVIGDIGTYGTEYRGTNKGGDIKDLVLRLGIPDADTSLWIDGILDIIAVKETTKASKSSSTKSETKSKRLISDVEDPQEAEEFAPSSSRAKLSKGQMLDITTAKVGMKVKLIFQHCSWICVGEITSVGLNGIYIQVSLWNNAHNDDEEEEIRSWRDNNKSGWDPKTKTLFAGMGEYLEVQ